MTAKDTLIAARALIADPAKWTRRFYAMDTHGQGCFGFNTGAVCFCGLGAIQHITDHFEPEDVREPLTAAARALFPDRTTLGFASFNDHPDTTHADVLAVFDKAIASC